MVFKLDDQPYALPLAVVERIVRAVEVTPLPDAPRIMLGVVDVEDEALGAGMQGHYLNKRCRLRRVNNWSSRTNALKPDLRTGQRPNRCR